MKLKTQFILASILMAFFVLGQNKTENTDLEQSPKSQLQHPHSIGASFFMLGNFLADSPDYYLLTYGYRLTKKDRLFVEFNTWKFNEPLGTYGKSVGFYPGYVRSFGVGVGYQRFLWKGAFTTLQATPFLKRYHQVNEQYIQNGFQLYLQLIAGYRFELFDKRFYIEPAYALKYWPVDTNFPADFLAIDKGTPKYIFEPSLNFGFKF